MESAWNSLFWHDSNCIHSFSNWIKCSFQSIPCKRLKAVEWIFLNWGDIVNVICIRLKKFVNNYFNLKYDIVQVAHRTLLPGMLPWAIASIFFHYFQFADYLSASFTCLFDINWPFFGQAIDVSFLGTSTCPIQQNLHPRGSKIN